MTLRAAALATIALSVFAGSGEAFPRIRPFIPARLPPARFFVPPRVLAFPPGRPAFPLQQQYRPINTRVTVGGVTVPVTLRTVPPALVSFYRYAHAYHRAVERDVIRHDLRHGINPYANYYSLYANRFGYYPYAYNPYAYAGYGSYGYYNPYAANPYLTGMYASGLYGGGSYGGGSYGGGSYGGGGGYYSGLSGSSSYATTDNSVAGANPYSATPYGGYGGSAASPYGYSPSAPSEAKAANALTAFGIPNDGTDVQWPLGLRAALPKPLREVRDKLDAQLQILTTQAVISKANPLLVKEASKNVEQVRAWLGNHRDEMGEASFRDASDFLRRLDQGLAAVKGEK